MKLKKVVCSMLVLCLVLTAMPVMASAATVSSGPAGANGTDVKYKLDSNGTLRVYGSGPMYDWKIIQGSPNVPWTTAPWVTHAQDIKKVIIDSGVTHIGNASFAGCMNLTSVTIASSVKSIGTSAFYKCIHLEEIKLPSKLTTIGSKAFYDTGLKSITIPKTVTTIGGSAFGSTWLENVTIPENVTTISSGLFTSCDNLTSVTFQGPIQNIGASAFYSCDALVSCNFEKGLSGTIGASAFAYCSNLPFFDIPEGITRIGDSAFTDCDSFTSLTIPEGVEYIGDDAFRSIPITSVTIPSTVTYMGSDVFVFCDELKNVTMHTSTIEGMEDYLGTSKTLTYVHVIGDAPQVDTDVFGHTNEDFIVFYDEGTSGWEQPLWRKYIIEIWGKDYSEKTGICGENLIWTIKDGTLTISGTGAMDSYSEGTAPWYYYRKRFTNLKIEEGVTTIGDWAFSGLYTITEVTIPSTVTSIKQSAFWKCTKLKDVYFYGDAPEIGNFCFSGVTATAHYPERNDTWTPEITKNYGGTITWVNDIHIHDYTSESIQPTCTEQGYTIYTCTCGDSYKDSYVVSTGHSWTEISDEEKKCDVCGKVTLVAIPGDIDMDDDVDVDDVLALLWHVLFPEDYPIEVEADFDGNGATDVDDVLTLLWHVLFPEDYPL